MSELAKWLLELVKKIFSSAFDFLADVVIGVVDLFLTALLALLSALPLPDFMSGGGLQTLINDVPSEVWFFAQHLRLGECFAMLGSAFAFRLGRKALTLFQW